MENTERKTTVLITGCSTGGLGYAYAKEFHARGCFVIASARRKEALMDFEGKEGFSTVILDVTKQESIDDAKKKVEEITGGTLDILVNNAGVSLCAPLAEADISKARSLFETNVFGVMAVTNAFLPLLRSAKGLIMLISSGADRFPLPFQGVYGMSKAALSSYARNLTVELHYLQIRVMNVVTLFVESAINDKTPDMELKDDSWYRAMQGYEKGGPISDSRMSAEEYTSVVVSQALKGSGWRVGPLVLGGTPDWMMYGTKTGLTKMLCWFGEGAAKWFALKMWHLKLLSEVEGETK